ncbi:MAG: tetratricopeptide repeat protein [Elusimicrobia bacterium]|nr:tetratricopeptide repeat protein [Elusimicrobiota bacterium]
MPSPMPSVNPERRTLVLGVIALAASMGLWLRWYPRSLGQERCLASGALLVHGLPSEALVSRDMPLANVTVSLCQARPRLKAAAEALVGVAVPVLGFQLGCALCGPAGGLASAVLTSLPLDAYRSTLDEMRLYRVLFLLVAVLVAWRAGSPTPWRGAVAGAAIGVSLLCRSPLFLFAPALAAAGCWRERRAAGRWLAAAVLALAPVAVLAPWAVMNWRLGGGFSPFESGRADCNVTTGALGLVPTVEGDYFALAGIGPEDDVMRWAAGEVLRHPVRYAAAVAQRAWYVAGFHPVIIALWALSAWVCRRRREHAEVSFLLAYYLGIHCLMSVETTYFEPVWPVMLVLAGCGALEASGAGRREGGRPGLGLAWPYLAAALAAGLVVLRLAWVYPGRASSGWAAFEGAISRSPLDPLPVYFRGMRNLEQGRLDAAGSDFERAASLGGDSYLIAYARAWVLTLRDRMTPSAARDLARLAGDEAAGEIELLRLLRRGDLQAAAGAWARLEGLRGPTKGTLVRRTRTPLEQEAQSRLAGADKALGIKLLELARPLPAEERLRLLDGMSRVRTWPGLLVERASLLAVARPADALDALRRAAASSLDLEDGLAIAGVYERLDRPHLAEETLRPLLGRYPNSEVLRRRCAGLAARVGERFLLVDSLRTRLAARPAQGREGLPGVRDIFDEHARLLELRGVDTRRARRAAGSPGAWSRPAAALAAYEELAGLLPEDPEVALVRAGLLGRLGRTDEALAGLAKAHDLAGPAAQDHEAALGRAELLGRLGRMEDGARVLDRVVDLSADQGILLRVIGSYKALGRPERALAAYGKLARLAPGDPGVALGRAELLAALGRGRDALAALDTAAGAAADEAGLRRVAACYESLGRPERALAAYDRLSGFAPGDPDVAFSRAELLAGLGRREEAARALDKAAGLAQDKDRLRRIIELYGKLGLPERALTAYDKLSRLAPGDPGVALSRAELLVRSGRVKEALAALDNAAGLVSGAVDLRRVADCYKAAGKPERALAAYGKLAMLALGDPDVALDRAELLAGLGRREDAGRVLDKVSGRVTDLRGLRRLAELYGRLGRCDPAAAVRARLHLSKGESLLDAAACELAVDRRGTALVCLSAASQSALGQAQRHRLALLFQQADRPVEAVGILDLLVREHPERAEYRCDRGVSRAVAGRAEEAIADLREAIRLDPDLMTAYMSLGSVLLGRGQPGPAGEVFAAALARPRRPGDDAVRAAMRSQLKKLPK